MNPTNPTPMAKWIEFAKKEKAHALTMSDRGDIHPTVIVEINNDVKAVILAPDMDKEMGLFAAQLCKAGFDPDALIVMMDAHVATAPAKEGQTVEEAAEEFRKKYPPGSMQKMCDEGGACDLGEITDCLICHRIDRTGKINLVTMPYAYHGKDGPAFKWLEGDKGFETEITSEDKLAGYIPESLRAIMGGKSIFEGHPDLHELVKKVAGYSKERLAFHLARAAMSVLAVKKYVVGDFFSGEHPEWTMAKEFSIYMLKKMVSEGFLPKEAYEPFKSLLPMIGSKKFVDALTELLKENSYWLPSAGRKHPEIFAQEFANACLSPAIPSDLLGEKPESGKKRVKVWNGDRSEYLGEGEYVSDVAVHFVVMPDGSLNSEANPEVKPTNIPAGGKVVTSEKNPKIILDSGKTVYGCQVWWEPCEGNATPKKSRPSHFGSGSHNPAKN